MLKKISVFLFMWLCVSSSAWGLQGHRGDIIVAGSQFDSMEPGVMSTQNEIRAMNEALLAMGIPQYQFDDPIIDQQLINREFIFHVEILPVDWVFEDYDGWTWSRYRFTQLARTMLDPGYAGDIYKWITDQDYRYRLPFTEVLGAYRTYVSGGQVPLIMIGDDYGQTVRDYTNFADFYGAFMNKHHYCITASMWGILKAIYDKSPEMRQRYEDIFSDPHSVQAVDTLTGGRFLGWLVYIGFVEPY